MLRIAMMLPGLGRVQRGAETAFLELARSLSRDPDLEITLFGAGNAVPEGLRLHQAACPPRERFEGWPRFPGLRNENQFEELAFILSLTARRLYRPGDYDAVVGCSYPWVNWYLGWTGRSRGPKRIFSTQNGDYMAASKAGVARWFDCDGLICINPEQLARNRGRGSHPTALIPNGVDPEEYHPPDGTEPVDPRIPTDQPVVLMVSALIPDKRIDAGVRGVARVPEAFLVIAGDGRDRAAVAALAEQEIPGRYLLLGSIPRSEMPALYRRADVFLHMHRTEPFGIVYLEACATALPIVAPDAPTPRWILGDHAHYADPDDPDTVAEALQRALTDDGAATGRALRKRVMVDWTWDVQAARYRAFIEEVLHSSRASSSKPSVRRGHRGATISVKE